VAFNFPFEVEHVTPASHGGTGDDDNLALGCRSCNAFKSDTTTGVDPLTGELTHLLHPRDHPWSEHFTVRDAALIEGLTAIGRATVAKLQLNSPRQGGCETAVGPPWAVPVIPNHSAGEAWCRHDRRSV
jgi:hypothetical protein